jgi:hypothetical protein
MRWLVDEWQWLYAGALVAVFLLGVLPLWWDATAVADRAYNPGLWTAIGVFVPVSVWGAIEIGDAADAGVGWQLIGLAFALAVHAAIMGYIRDRARPHAPV